MLTPEEQIIRNQLNKLDAMTDVNNIFSQMVFTYEEVLKFHNIEVDGPALPTDKVSLEQLQERLIALKAHVK